MPLRQIGQSELYVQPIAMGCWPIAGMTSTFVNDVDSLATLQAALDAGINFLDTAFGYGVDGESEKLIGRVLRHRSDRVIVASKGGMEWRNGQRHFDASSATLIRQCETSLRRLGRDTLDLYYLHAPDQVTDLTTIAETFNQLIQKGKIRYAAVSNLTVEQIEAFTQVCPVVAVQDYFNMLQQEDRSEVIRWCRENDVAYIAYWPLMKGLLAGRLGRDHRFSDTDSRPRYDIYRGQEWERNQDFVDQLRTISEQAGMTVAQMVIVWTIQANGIHSVLCGAKRPYQILETAAAMHFQLDPQTKHQIDQAIKRRLDRGAAEELATR